MLAQHDLSQLLLVPVVHSIFLLLLLLRLSVIDVQIPLLRLPHNIHVVTELAFLPLLAYPFLEELA